MQTNKIQIDNKLIQPELPLEIFQFLPDTFDNFQQLKACRDNRILEFECLPIHMLATLLYLSIKKQLENSKI